MFSLLVANITQFGKSGKWTSGPQNSRQLQRLAAVWLLLLWFYKHRPSGDPALQPRRALSVPGDATFATMQTNNTAEHEGSSEINQTQCDLS